MTGDCLKYHQHKMHVLDTTSAFLCIKMFCPYLLEMEVIFGILFPHEEFMNSWLVFSKRCFSLPRIYIKKKKKKTKKWLNQGVLTVLILKLRNKKVGLFSMNNTFHFRIMAWIHYVDWTTLWYHSMLTRTVTHFSCSIWKWLMQYLSSPINWDPRSVILFPHHLLAPFFFKGETSICFAYKLQRWKQSILKIIWLISILPSCTHF